MDRNAPAVLTPMIGEEIDDADRVVIGRRRGLVRIDWAELVRNRELLYFLTLRDVKVRYKQTVLGAAWAMLQPLFTMAIFTVIFGRLAGIKTGDVPYPVFVFAGLIPWTLFSNGVAGAAQSLVSQQALLTKVYFPRLFIPTAVVAAFLVDMGITLGIYAVIVAAYRIVPSWQVVFLPIFVALSIVATLGPGLMLAALTVTYRDFRYVVPFLIQVLLYLSPVIVPLSILPERFRLLAALNPMCGIIEGFRSCILGVPWDVPVLAVSTFMACALLMLGLIVFGRTERRFADLA